MAAHGQPSARAVVFDLGGTHLRSGLVTASGRLAAVEIKRIPSVATGAPASRVWRGVIAAITEYVGESRHSLAGDAPVVVSFPGPIDDGSRVLSAPTLVRDTELLPEFGKCVSSAVGRPVHLLNDISAAAWYFSTRTAAGRFLVVTVSSGIGSKMVDRGNPRMVLDDLPYGGEIGHLCIDTSEGAAPCGCGGRGHLGMISSGRGVELCARGSASRSPEEFRSSRCHDLCNGDASTITNEQHIVPAALEGDQWSLRIISRCTRPLAQILSAVVLAAGLEEVILIGGFALSLGDTYLAVLRRHVSTFLDYHVLADRWNTILRLGDPGEEACLEGAGCYAEHLVSGEGGPAA